MAAFRHGRLLFAGDAAHQVSPFGARGANSGLEDAHNLCWKLAAVLQGEASERLIDSYCRERELAADDNIVHSTRATDFISPKSPIARTFRNAALKLAREAPFAARLINSGRLSTPSHYAGSPLSTPDEAVWEGPAKPGSPAPDAPVIGKGGKSAWLLDTLSAASKDFAVLSWDNAATASSGTGLISVGCDIVDADGLLGRRYGASSGTTYLIRPDQYVAARFKRFDPAAIAAARLRALGRT
jgi:3-(3-hydroxy-phenyl)propionate hydroxylase